MKGDPYYHFYKDSPAYVMQESVRMLVHIEGAISLALTNLMLIEPGYDKMTVQQKKDKLNYEYKMGF